MFIKLLLNFSILVFCVPSFTLEKAELVEIQKINPRIKINMVWQTGENFLKLKLYKPDARCYILKEAAYALDLIQQELEKVGLGLMILEAYRPLSAQQEIWQAINFIPNSPLAGRHTRGASVDLIIVNIKTGLQIDSPPINGPESDPRMHHGAIDGLTEEQIKNREMLKNIMLKYGFEFLDEEWYHYDYKNWQEYMPLNYDVKNLS